jgi:serine-type D-Ala-D-Ala endopeptidase (penicillin-binding protein 7)
MKKANKGATGRSMRYRHAARRLVLVLLVSAGLCPALALAHGRAVRGSPALRSNSVYVLDETSSSVLLSRQADVAMPIASITKLMTALVVLEAGQRLDEPLEITADDSGGTGKRGVSRLKTGTTLSRADLLHLALMSSENRAAHALGRNYPGGLPACVQAMNAKAQALGMKSAHFVEPTGLSSGNVASPADLAKLVQASAESHTIQEYSTDESYAVPIRRHLVEFHNTDSLVRNPSWNIVVQKTGYISEAGRCLVMKAIFEGRSVVIVLLDSAGKRTRFADAVRIRKWMESRLAAASARAGAPKA